MNLVDVIIQKLSQKRRKTVESAKWTLTTSLCQCHRAKNSHRILYDSIVVTSLLWTRSEVCVRALFLMWFNRAYNQHDTQHRIYDCSAKANKLQNHLQSHNWIIHHTVYIAKLWTCTANNPHINYRTESAIASAALASLPSYYVSSLDNVR